MKEKVRKLGLEGSVKFLGVRNDVADILQSFDLFLLPSLYEGLPVTMIEAQAAGLPCVISDKVPIQCDITGNTKVVSLEDSTDKWAREVLDYLKEYNRKDMFDQIKNAGFDIKENAKWLEDFYREVLQ